MVVLWNPSYWKVEDIQKAFLSRDPTRTALCLKLQRATTRSIADEEHVFVILTKFHLGIAESGNQFNTHD